MASTRRLSILHTEDSGGWGGQEIRILTESHGMLERGHRVTLLATADSPILAAALRMGIPAQPVAIGRKRVGPLLALRAWLARFGHEYDLINTHGSTDSWLTAVASASLPWMPPIVRTRHVSTPVNNNIATRWLYTKATAHIVTTGEKLREQLNRVNGYPLERMTSIRTGIDLERYRPRDPQRARRSLAVRDVPTLGILATLRDWKGHQDLLTAFSTLHPRFPEWQVLIIGDGPERRRLEERVDALALRDAVRFVGNVDDAPAWLAALDLFVLPSYGSEGVPQSIMQAMACGLAVVSTPVGAIEEAVRDGVTGLLAPPRDPPALAGAMAALMADPARRGSMGRAALAFARESFGLEAMLDKMEQVFHRHAVGA